MNRRFRRRVRLGVHSGSEERMKMIKIAAVVAAVLALIIILSVIWGNALKRKAEESQNEDDGVNDQISDTQSDDNGKEDKEEILPPSNYNAAAVPVVNAGYITLSSYQGIDWGSRASTLKGNGVSAVSLVLYYDGGTLNFNSKTAQAMGFQDSSTTKTNLYEAMGVLNISDIHSSGCFYSDYLSKGTPEVKSVYRAYEAALIAEAIEAGFSDILIFGFSADYESALEAGRLVEAVRNLEKGAKIGFVLNCNGRSVADTEAAFRNFSSVADFLAIDLCSVGSEAEIYPEIERLSAIIKSYNLRIVFSESFTDAKEGLRARGYFNWQIVP